MPEITPGHDDRYSKGAGPIEVDGVLVECVDMQVVDVEDDGTRVVRVFVLWGDVMRHADVRFDRVTWEAHGGK